MSSHTRRIDKLEATARPNDWRKYEHLPVSHWPDSAIHDRLGEMTPSERRSLFADLGSPPEEIDAIEREITGARR